MDLSWLREIGEFREVGAAMSRPRYWKTLAKMTAMAGGLAGILYAALAGVGATASDAPVAVDAPVEASWHTGALWVLCCLSVVALLVSAFWVWRAERGGPFGDDLDHYRELPLNFGTMWTGSGFDILARYGGLLIAPREAASWSAEIRGHIAVECLAKGAPPGWQPNSEADRNAWEPFHGQIMNLALDMELRGLLEPRVHGVDGRVAGACRYTPRGRTAFLAAHALAKLN